jgi:SpoVK/Ycf46/Vps4 family AAA+-type ATPase
MQGKTFKEIKSILIKISR